MSFNLLKTTKDLFNNEMVTRASSFLGETPENTKLAIEASIPTVVSELAHKNATVAGASTLADIIKNGNFTTESLHNFATAFDKSGSAALHQGQVVATSLFGKKISNTANAIGNFSGVSDASATALLGVVSTMVLHLLSRHKTDESLNNESFSSVLSHQKNFLPNFLPAGFASFYNTMGYDKNMVAPASHAAQKIVSAPNSGAPKWMLPVIIGLLILGALWYFLGMKGCNNTNIVSNADSTATTMVANADSALVQAKGTVDSITGDYIYNLGKIIPITLPNGQIINVGEFSTEARLVAFLSDKTKLVDSLNGNWFEFTGVRFKTGGSELSDSSMNQLKNFVAIAKAFPNAKFKIGGYTDSTGIAAKNLNLSNERANAVYKAVIMLGASQTSLTGAKGYGSAYPIGDNTTTEGRALNRRVAVNVKSK